jgi:DNA replication licensing factor MCM6
MSHALDFLFPLSKPQANVNMSAPILSRFDLLFVVLDECNPDSDRQVAQHILKVHRCVQRDPAAVPFRQDVESKDYARVPTFLGGLLS